eukprot:4566678-Alexandrium_andersonii.AAC.1
MALQFCSSMSRLPSWFSRWLLAAIPMQLLIDHISLEPVYQVLAWSFRALASGFMPCADHTNEPFSSNTKRASLGGEPICGGYQMLICEVRAGSNHVFWGLA